MSDRDVVIDLSPFSPAGFQRGNLAAGARHEVFA
jgi:hypothetical protein